MSARYVVRPKADQDLDEQSCGNQDAMDEDMVDTRIDDDLVLATVCPEKLESIRTLQPQIEGLFRRRS